MSFINSRVLAVMLATLRDYSPHLHTCTPCVIQGLPCLQHLESSGVCRDSCSAESFTILDFVASSFQFKMKEGAVCLKIIKRELKELNKTTTNMA